MNVLDFDNTIVGIGVLVELLTTIANWLLLFVYASHFLIKWTSKSVICVIQQENPGEFKLEKQNFGFKSINNVNNPDDCLHFTPSQGCR